jgi:hypothetical protein
LEPAELHPVIGQFRYFFNRKTTFTSGDLVLTKFAHANQSNPSRFESTLNCLDKIVREDETPLNQKKIDHQHKSFSD